MKLTVQVKANSKVEKVDRMSENKLSVWVKAPAKEGRANLAVVECLSDYFGVAKSRITILKGAKNKSKLVEILE